LVGANLIAAGIASRHPPATMSVMFLYWAECAVVGAFAILKLWFIPIELTPQLERQPAAKAILVVLSKIVLSAAFVFHFGMFLLLAYLPIAGVADHELRWRGIRSFDADAYLRGFLLPVAAISAGHAVSFFVHFIGKREWRGRTQQQQMLMPYGRVLAMLGIGLAGGLLVAVLRLPAVAVVVFVVLKIVADLHAHFRDHRPRATPDPRT
jgi:hypothetical protein